MTWTELDWPALDRLREGFLHGGAAQGPYWQSVSALASYDQTYGERIGWKWDHVLRELQLRQWTPNSATLLDWGCGSGIATRRILSHFGADRFSTVRLWDHELIAADFAQTETRRHFPALKIETVTPGFLQGDEPIGLLLVSHVLNELSPEAKTQLLKLIVRAEAVIWVESGTSEVSRSLGAIRDQLASTFKVVAPCTHQNTCPVFAPDKERDWCHFFAPPPTEIFANPDWVKFGQRAGIDLRSLPYCFVVLDRRPPEPVQGYSRIIGRPEHFKPYARFLNCDANGLALLTQPKRNNPALFKELDRTKSPLIYRWQRDGDKVTNGIRLGVE
ncbi:MAG: small ribosomal subunit Rsm22 family protein [Cephaloticoccus sp.]|nr:small ribosomal subunit Rsm22 family protein [Cephaloticoccus sp.]MCF7760256.1 small ribosomal subunit Rsm22 family protein [Cephaloticoccus sp.]